MARYIELDALIAEIERSIANYKKISVGIDKKGDDWVYSMSMLNAKIDVLQHILSYLNTLEVKEVDLDKVITSWAHEFYEIPYDDVERMAKYFFELGLKAAQKGE